MTTRISRPTNGASRPRNLGTKLTRPLAATVIVSAAALTLTGCIVTYDAAKPELLVVNDYSEDVVAVIEGLKSEIDTPVDASRANAMVVDKCMGTAIRVETTSGDILGRVEEQACPGWTLTVNEDGTLTYTEDGK
ncbi:hypothetical protein RN607_11250 [Demequina capsici]|uniref:Uncharacterized protein n=1 Tax=Demequina capsici TaxID=3075620 RepID=A0AA96FBE4_9MICO|nr:hypothetical protein [Demequina sp. PMTSA13]WNM26767.1 hypothetical protein RN607_11250 [Demequina sp. PMTSA13]